MGEQQHHSGGPSGFQYDNVNRTQQGKNELNNENKRSKEDKDLVIEENTVYEIDRECYERLRRQKKHKIQEKKSI
jgi:hypothetical protein